MALPDPSNSIDDQAAHWAVEATYGDMSPESRAELDAWLAVDPRHRGAFVRVRAALDVMEQAVVGAHSAAAALDARRVRWRCPTTTMMSWTQARRGQRRPPCGEAFSGGAEETAAGGACAGRVRRGAGDGRRACPGAIQTGRDCCCRDGGAARGWFGRDAPPRREAGRRAVARFPQDHAVERRGPVQGREGQVASLRGAVRRCLCAGDRNRLFASPGSA